MAGKEKWLGPDGDYPAPTNDEILERLTPGLVVISRSPIPDLPLPKHNCPLAGSDEAVVIEFGQIVDETGCCLVCGEDLNDI